MDDQDDDDDDDEGASRAQRDRTRETPRIYQSRVPLRDLLSYGDRGAKCLRGPRVYLLCHIILYVRTYTDIPNNIILCIVISFFIIILTMFYALYRLYNIIIVA